MNTKTFYINRNTPELRKKLVELGYIDSFINDHEYRQHGIICRGNKIIGVPKDSEEFNIQEYLKGCPYIINCEGNEEMFLELATLNK